MTASWHWHQGAEHPYLSTSLLSAWPHGFFTRHSWPAGPARLSPELATAVTVHRARQVHGDRVVTPEDIPAEPDAANLPSADAVMTLAPQQAVWVCTADCTPVLIADSQTGQVAAVHAGWRGTALSIVPKTIAKLQAQGSDLSQLRIAMGPAIAGEVYQVTTHVAAEVGRSLSGMAPELAQLADEEVVARLQAIAAPPILPDAQPGRVRLDVRRINALQLSALGIAPEHIAIAPHCTFQEPDRFFSYRRTREKQVQWSGIVSC